MLQKKTSFIIVMLISSFGYSAQAKEPLHYSPEQRFMVPRDEDLDNVMNVQTKMVRLVEAPKYIQQQLNDMSTQCTDNKQNANNVAIYSYTSKSNRKNKFPPSYILDFSSWKKLALKDCMFATPCDNGQCLLIGYKAEGPNTWIRSFSQYPAGWVFTSVGEKSQQKTYLKMISVSDNCEFDGGELVDRRARLCRMTYAWQGDGLAVINQRAKTQ